MLDNLSSITDTQALKALREAVNILSREEVAIVVLAELQIMQTAVELLNQRRSIMRSPL